MDIKDIRLLLDAVAKTGTSELSLETPDYKVTVKRGSAETVTSVAQVVNPPIAHQLVSPVVQSVVAPTVDVPKLITPATSNLIDITAPIVGTFYISPSPEAAAFVKVGDKVEQGKVLCIIEAMKLMNEIEAEVSGTIAEVLVKNEEPVEYGQVLFRVSPL
jgi:acetyl-CoA carboxylase biotin carboxyl carrier protein